MQLPLLLNQDVKFKHKCAPYKIGNEFIDCSALICYLLNIPRMNIDELYHSKLFRMKQDMIAGDIIIYPSRNFRSGHVALFTSPTTIIHAHPKLPGIIAETDLALFRNKRAIILGMKNES